MDFTNENAQARRGLRRSLVLLLLPALMLFAACDSSDTNQLPDADFGSSTDGLTANFTDQSDDPDGEVTTYAWEFGDGGTSEEASPSYTYGQEGTYSVTLTVTDNAGETDDISKDVTVAPNVVQTPEYANYDSTSTGIVFRESGNENGVVPSDGTGNDNVRANYVKWTADNEYIISGRTFVNDGDTLEIEPGTVVRGRSNQDPTNASVLIVARGGTILADGNPGSDDPSTAQPIIFTAEEDDVNSTTDLSENLDGAWGGVIILGNAPNNTDPASVNIEGIPSDVERGAFGGDEPDDDSGVFRFASIRYGGISIGAGNEINGLTMGGVGNGTTIEYVEIFNNRDDGFEWFGGTVNANNLVVTRTGDDSFDIDFGYNGSLQFLLAIQTTNRGDRAGEHDSGNGDFGGEGSTPVARPPIFNATYIGSGGVDNDGDGNPDGQGDISLKLRDNFGGSYYNSIFFDFPTDFIEIEDLASGPDSRQEFEDMNLRVENNTLFQFWEYDQAAATPWNAIVENGGTFGVDVATYVENQNTYGDPGIVRDMSGNITTLVPPAGTAAVEGNTTSSPNAFIQDVTYRGAFEPGGTNWASWTFAAEIGLIPNN